MAVSPAPVAPSTSTPAPSNGASSSVKPSPSVVKPNPVGSAPSQNNQAASPPPESTLPQKQRWTAKIDGKEQEFEASEEDLRSAYLQRSGAQRRFEESARIRKEAQAETEKTKQMFARLQDPEQLLSVFMEANPNADPIEVMSAILQKRLHEEEQLQDPNIRERRRLERENEAYKTKEQQAEEARIHAEHEQATNRELDSLSGRFMEALEQTKLPRNDIVLKLMGEAEFTNRKNGWALSPAQLAKATEKSVNNLIESMLTNETTTDDQLLDAFPALTKRIHRGIVARYKTKQAGGQSRQPGDVAPRPSQPATEEPAKARVMSSAEEHKAYGIKGLRTF